MPKQENDVQDVEIELEEDVQGANIQSYQHFSVLSKEKKVSCTNCIKLVVLLGARLVYSGNWGWQFLSISISMNPTITHLIWISLNPTHLNI